MPLNKKGQFSCKIYPYNFTKFKTYSPKAASL